MVTSPAAGRADRECELLLHSRTECKPVSQALLCFEWFPSLLLKVCTSGPWSVPRSPECARGACSPFLHPIIVPWSTLNISFSSYISSIFLLGAPPPFLEELTFLHSKFMWIGWSLITSKNQNWDSNPKNLTPEFTFKLYHFFLCISLNFYYSK